MASIGRDGYGDSDHDDERAVGAEPPTPPSLKPVPRAPDPDVTEPSGSDA